MRQYLRILTFVQPHVSFALGGGDNNPNPNVDTGIQYGPSMDYLDELLGYEMYGGDMPSYTPPPQGGSNPHTPPPSSGGGGGGGGTPPPGSPRPQPQPDQQMQTRSAQAAPAAGSDYSGYRDFLNGLVQEGRAAGGAPSYFPSYQDSQFSGSGVQSFGQHEFQGSNGAAIRVSQNIVSMALMGRPVTREQAARLYQQAGVANPERYVSQLDGLGAFGGGTTTSAPQQAATANTMSASPAPAAATSNPPPITQEEFMSTQPAGAAGYGAQPLGGQTLSTQSSQQAAGSKQPKPPITRTPAGPGYPEGSYFEGGRLYGADGSPLGNDPMPGYTGGTGYGFSPPTNPPLPPPKPPKGGGPEQPPGGGGGGPEPPPGGGGGTPPPAEPGNLFAGGSSGARRTTAQAAYDQLFRTLQNPGYSDAVRNAMAQESANAARARYAGAGGQITRHAATTGNRAGVAAGLSQLARSEAGTLSEAARRNAIAQGQEEQRQREWATGGMGQMYGAETSYLSNLFGQRGDLAARPRGTGIRQRRGGEGGTTDFLNPTRPYWGRVGDEERP